MKKTKIIFNVQNILFLIAICFIFCGCEKIKKDKKNQEKQKKIVNSNNVILKAKVKDIYCNTNIPDAGILHRLVTSNTFAFENALIHENTLRSILTINDTNDITFAGISNQVAGISSKEILDFIIPSGDYNVRSHHGRDYMLWLNYKSYITELEISRLFQKNGADV